MSDQRKKEKLDAVGQAAVLWLCFFAVVKNENPYNK